MQTVVTILIGIVAIIYVVKIFTKQFMQVETNPKCENCPIPDIINQNKQSVKKQK